jgi:trimeric autotransporter adhesin
MTTGTANTGLGKRTLTGNTTGSNNTAVGAGALNANVAGGNNTAVGFQALTFNTASNNTATGYQVLFNNSTGSTNTAAGYQALLSNTTGFSNVADGYQALIGNTSGFNNTACGLRGMFSNTTGSCNTTLGYAANVSVGNLTNATAIGCLSIVNASNKIRLGDATVTVIEGQVAYTFPSDGRFKFNVTEEVKGLDFITKFQEFLTQNMPEADRAEYLQKDFGPSTAVRQSGFIAQEVEQVAKQVNYDFNGVHKPVDANDNYSVAYAEFVVPLVKAVQEQQQMITQQQQQIDMLQKQVVQLTTAQNNAGAEAAKVNAVNGVKMYPNPTGGMITLTTQAMDAASIEVYDMAGTRVYQAALKAATTNHEIDLSAYPRGMYSVKVMAKGQEVSSQKLVLQ